jgi:hypothetical protein
MPFLRKFTNIPATRSNNESGNEPIEKKRKCAYM